MGYAKYVGRVGALAVALGIGTAAATTPWVAVAEPSPDSSNESSESSATQSTSPDDSSPATSVDTSSETDAPEDAPTEGADEEPTDATDTEIPEAPEDSAIPDYTEGPDVATDSEPSTPELPSVSPTTPPVAAGSSDDDDAPVVHAQAVIVDGSPDAQVTVAVRDDQAEQDPMMTTAITTVESAPPEAVMLSTLQTTVVETQQVSSPDVAEVVPTPVTALMSGLLAWVGLGPSLTPGPVTPAQPPLLWALMAWTRREIGGTPANQTPIVARDPAENSQSLDEGEFSPDSTRAYVASAFDKTVSVTGVSAAQSNIIALQGVPVFQALRTVVSDVISGLFRLVSRVTEAFQHLFLNRTPTTAYDPAENIQAADGVVTGDLNAADADGDPLSFTIIQIPQKGTLKLHPDGTFTYTQSREFAATGGTDVFTVKVSDGGGHFHGLRSLFQPDSGHSTTATVAIFDPQVVDNIDVGRGPTGLAFSPDGAHVYVSNRQDGTVSVIDNGTDAVTAIIGVGDQPLEVAVTPDGDHIYVSNLADGTVSVIDTETFAVATIAPGGAGARGLAVTPDGDTVYVANFDTVSVIDTETNTVTTIAVGDGPGLVAVSPDGATAYVANLGDDTVSVIDTETNTVTKTIAVGDLPAGMAVNPDGDHVYVANSDGTVSVIDTETNTVTATIVVGDGPQGVAVSPDGTRLYVTQDAVTVDDDVVSVIDTATNSVIATIAFGNDAPQGVAVSPDGTRLYVANVAQGTVTVISV